MAVPSEPATKDWVRGELENWKRLTHDLLDRQKADARESREPYQRLLWSLLTVVIGANALGLYATSQQVDRQQRALEIVDQLRRDAEAARAGVDARISEALGRELAALDRRAETTEVALRKRIQELEGRVAALETPAR